MTFKHNAQHTVKDNEATGELKGRDLKKPVERQTRDNGQETPGPRLFPGRSRGGISATRDAATYLPTACGAGLWPPPLASQIPPSGSAALPPGPPVTSFQPAAQ